jgi:hypothetical protein
MMDAAGGIVSAAVGMCVVLVVVNGVGHKQTNSVAFSPQANYTYRMAAACRRSQCQLLRVEGVAWSVQRITVAVNLRSLDQSGAGHC